MSPIYIYGREPHVASAVQSLTLDEAKVVAQDVARALTDALRTVHDRAESAYGARLPNQGARGADASPLISDVYRSQPTHRVSGRR